MKHEKKAYTFFIVLLSFILFMARDVDDSPLQRRLLSITLDPTLVTTTSTRSNSVQNFCKASKSDLISSGDKNTNKQYFSMMSTYFKADITQIIKNALDGNMSGVLDGVKQQGVSLGIYVVPFLIGFILSIFLWAFLCCCCTCPSCCPSKCCQHAENVLYTKCELYWPAIFLLVLLALVVGASIPGLTQASKLADSVETMQCGVAVVLDDLLNGNMTSDKTSFFSGTNTLVNLLNQLTLSVSTIVSQFNSVQTAVDNVKNTANTIKSNIETLGTLGLGASNSSFSLTYTNPTPGSVYTADSLFGSVLGNPTVDGSISYILYQVIDGIHSAMTTLSANIGNIDSVAGSGDLVDQINQGISSFSPINTQINDVDSTVYDMFQVIGPILGYVRIGVLVFFAVSVGLAVLVVIGTVFTTFCDKPKCRYLMYIPCIIITIILILGFLIAVVLSIMNPLLFMGCTVLNSGLNTQAGFVNFTANLGMTGNNITSIVSVCLPGGDGNILNSLGVPELTNLNSNLDGINSIMSEFNSYLSFDTAALATSATNVSDQIETFVTGKRNDIFNNPDAITYFSQLASGNQYSLTCSNTNYSLDSLVPSTDSQSTSIVACTKSNTVKCTSASDTFQNLASGCIDLTSCFPYYDTNPTDISVHFGIRYSGCPTIGVDIQSIYNNWDLVRRNPTTGIKAVKDKYDTDVKTKVSTDLIADINQLKTDAGNAVTALTGTTNQITNPTYGLVAGLNCKVLGQDIVMAKDTVCVSLFNSLYFLFVTVGITSFAFLFGICCITCTGVRHYKQDQTRQKIGGDYGDKSSYQQTQIQLNQNNGIYAPNPYATQGAYSDHPGAQYP